MNRAKFLQQIFDRREPWDIAVVGGGATGVGIAVDAAARGFNVALLEQSDFGTGTSSRSTKLVHGGVRYLQQGNVSLVMEALKERGLKMYLASGTDQIYMREEARLLDVDRYFDGMLKITCPF